MLAARLLRAVCVVFGVIVVAMQSAPEAKAHESRPAYLLITETAPTQFALTWRTPMRGGIPLPVVLRLPDNVRDIRDPLVQTLSDSWLERLGSAAAGSARVCCPVA